MICDIFDDVLEPHIAELIQSQIKKEHWKYDYNSNKNIGIQPHWHIFCGENIDVVTKKCEKCFNIKASFGYIWQQATHCHNCKSEDMKNVKAIVLLMVMLIAAPISGYSQQQAGGAAGGMSVGTAVAIGVVGAALLVALGDSSSSAPAGVAAATADSAQTTATTGGALELTTVNGFAFATLTSEAVEGNAFVIASVENISATVSVPFVNITSTAS